MADEQNTEGNAQQVAFPKERPAESAQATGEEVTGAEVSGAENAPPVPKKPSLAPFVVSLLFVLAAVAGIFSYAWNLPVSWLLGSGLLGWGLMDLFSQRSSLKAWKDHSSIWANILGILRMAFFIGLGARLLAQTFGHAQLLSANTLFVIGAGFVCSYLICAYAVELVTRSKEILSHALLLAALALQFISFFCFAVPFTLTWAALLSVLSLIFVGVAMTRGVTKASKSLAPSVAVAVALLGTPLAVFFIQQIFLTEQQPVFQGSVLLPRFFELKRDLSKSAENLAWAPAQAVPGTRQGAQAYSDKIAFVDEKDGKTTLTVCTRNDDVDSFVSSLLHENSDPVWWAPNAKLLFATGSDVKDGMGRLSIYFGKQLTRSSLRSEDVMPAATHGQVWAKDSKTFFYAGPKSLRMLGGTGIFSARVNAGTAAPQLKSLSNQAWPSKVYPAVAPDSSKVLYVGEKENKKFINIGETEEGLRPRVFLFSKEQNLFPAWNKEQTHVLFVDAAGMLKIMSANNKSDAEVFTRERLHSQVWKNEQAKVFTLTKAETGDYRQVWTMNLDGTGKKMIYESRCNEIFPPTWSQDSTRIALVERSGSRYSVLTLGKDGSWPRKFFVTGDRVRSLTWSPDSALLAWFADRHEGMEQELWIASKDSMNPTLAYTAKGDLSNLAWSPRGQHMAFEERWSFGLMGLRMVRPWLYSVKVLDLKDFSARSVTLGGLFARRPAFSPQGTMLAFIMEQNRWSLVDSPKRPATLAVARLF